MPVLLSTGGETSIGPVLPQGFDAIWWLVALALVVLTVAALVRILRSPGLTTTSRTVWVLLVLLTAPVGAIGALLLVHPTGPSAESRG